MSNWTLCKNRIGAWKGEFSWFFLPPMPRFQIDNILSLWMKLGDSFAAERKLDLNANCLWTCLILRKRNNENTNRHSRNVLRIEMFRKHHTDCVQYLTLLTMLELLSGVFDGMIPLSRNDRCTAIVKWTIIVYRRTSWHDYHTIIARCYHRILKLVQDYQAFDKEKKSMSK